jgi:hypothetical protein
MKNKYLGMVGTIIDNDSTVYEQDVRVVHYGPLGGFPHLNDLLYHDGALSCISYVFEVVDGPLKGRYFYNTENYLETRFGEDWFTPSESYFNSKLLEKEVDNA